jgi:serine/threonine-protein kinase
MGTPDYMAPEQIEGQRGDQRTDVYALGTILYEMLSVKTPFTGDTNMVIMAQHLQKDAPRLDHVNSAVSAELAAIVSRCLARDPDKRYPDMLAFINGLDHPESADLGILDTLDSPAGHMSLWQSQAFRGIVIALAILAGFTMLALILQALHK